MSLWKVAWRSIQQRFLVSALTVVSMGLGVALVVAVLVVYGVVYQSFHRGGEGYDLIVGAKGGREQLVLNTVFYLSQPVGNIPYEFFEELTIGKLASAVELAVSRYLACLLPWNSIHLPSTSWRLSDRISIAWV